MDLMQALRARPGAEGGVGMAEQKEWRILVINPGSTSTKIGVFEGEREVLCVGGVLGGAALLVPWPWLE